VALGRLGRLGRVEAGVSRTAAVRVRPLREHDGSLEDPGELRRQAETLGYLFFRRLVAPEEARALRVGVLDACDELAWLDRAAPRADGVVRAGMKIGRYDDTWTALQRRIVPLPEFTVLRDHPAILQVLRILYRAPVRAGRGDACRVFSPGAPDLTTRPHQDHFYVRGDVALWTVWVPLGDCPLELGGLAVLPGSHREGLRPHAGAGTGEQGVDVGPDAVWATSTYRCGDVLMFNSLTLHRALENRTADRLRISADFRYEPDTTAIPDGDAPSFAPPHGPVDPGPAGGTTAVPGDSAA
jgi:Phytanoyl-CoA dioxygenase (PhyH)